MGGGGSRRRPPEGGGRSPPPSGKCFFFRRAGDVQHVVNNRLFFTPGYYYRPNELKSMSCLLGNTEARTVYRNFDLANLNVNLSDRTHMLYNRYLTYNCLVPPDEKRYFAHLPHQHAGRRTGFAKRRKGSLQHFPAVPDH